MMCVIFASLHFESVMRIDEQSSFDPEADEWLEHLTGAHSTKPSFYAAWRRSEAGLERSITALQEISSALCATTEGVIGLSRAVLQTATRHFDAFCVAMVPKVVRYDPLYFQPIALIDGQEVNKVNDLPILIQKLGNAAVNYGVPVLVEKNILEARPFDEAKSIFPCDGLAVPILIDGAERGSLVVLPRRPALVDMADISILRILAQQTVVALRNIALYHESELLREEAVRGWDEANRKAQELKHQNEQLQSTQLQLFQEKQQRLIDTERGRIATELHDSVAQYLISIGMNLEWCKRWSNKDEALQERLISTHELSRIALSKVRTTIVQLSCLEGGLLVALGHLGNVLRTQIQIVVREQGSVGYLSQFEEHAIFHVIQEAIFNMVRHGNAKHAWVTIRVTTKTFQISIADDSTSDPVQLQLLINSAVPSPTSPHQRGMTTIRERALELGAHIEVVSRRGGGICLIFSGSIRNQFKGN